MRYINGKQVSKQKYEITIEVTDNELNMFDNLVRCICTLDGVYHPLEPQYEKLLARTEKALWKYVDYYKDKEKLNNPKNSKY
ncbi:MAG: hypothetical protein WCX82_04395 [archaeon]|jgi:hypothetical protein